VACDNCLDAWSTENIEPPCFYGLFQQPLEEIEDEPGINCCWIPDVSDDERRVLAMRNRLVSLADLGIGAEILRMYDATTEDIEMIAIIEDELKAIQEETKGSDNG